MSETPKAYVPADSVCLSLGIGLSFAGAFVLWLVVGMPWGFGLFVLGVLAAVLGMFLAGVCARSQERDILGLGHTLGLRRAEGKAPADEAPDPLRSLERDAGATNKRGGVPPKEDGNA